MSKSAGKKPSGGAKGVSFSSSVPSGDDAAVTLASLLSLAPEDDAARLGQMKVLWTSADAAAIETLLREAAQQVKTQVDQYTKSTSPLPAQSYATLRSLLGVIALLARRDYTIPLSRGNGTLETVANVVFPEALQAVLLLLEVPERVVEAAVGADGAAAAGAGPSALALKFHSLHAFNRLLEGVPDLTARFVPLMAESAARELTQIVQSCAPAVAAASSSGADSALAQKAGYACKLLETLGMLVSRHASARALRARSHSIMADLLALLQAALLQRVQEKERVDAEAKAAAAPSSSSSASALKAKASVSSSVTPLHELVLTLLNVAGLLLRSNLLALPTLYPSARYLYPARWPFGSDAQGAAEGGDGEDEDASKGEDEEGEGQEDGGNDGGVSSDEEEEAEGDAPAAPAAEKPRACFTEPLSALPPRRGVTPLRVSSATLQALLDALWRFHEVCGIEGSSSSSGSSAEAAAAGVVNDAGQTVLAFVPLIVAMDNQRVSGTVSAEAVAAASAASGVAGGEDLASAEELETHTTLLQSTSDFLVARLQDLDLASRAFHPALAMAASSYIRCLGSVFRWTRRSAAQPFLAEAVYADLLNWLGDASPSFPRAALLRLRRVCVSAFLALLYCLDAEFHPRIGSAAFFAELFPLLASPLLTSHLVWFLRGDAEHLGKKVLPLVMRGLLNTKTRASPSAKTVRMILISLGNVACFARAVAVAVAVAAPQAAGGSGEEEQRLAVVPLLAPYLEQLLDTVVATVENSPGEVGQVGVLVLSRVLLATHDSPEALEVFPRVLRLFRRALDERLFVAAQRRAGQDEYDEDDQDVVGQLQYAVLDALHLMVQAPSAEGTGTAEREARGELSINSAPHPFSQARLLAALCGSVECVRELRRIVAVLLGNTLRPLLFAESDEAALRNSEIHLLAEALAHAPLRQVLLVASPLPEDAEAAGESEDEEDDDEGEAGAAEPAAAESVPALPPPPAVTGASLLHTLLRALALARADGSSQAERVFQYRSFLSGLTKTVRAEPDLLAQMRAAVQDKQQDEAAKAALAEAKKDQDTWRIVTEWTK